MKPKGQAILPLLILIVIIMTLGVSAIELAIHGLIVDRYSQDWLTSYYTVGAAMENALLRILRNPDYPGESLQINNASCTIQISGTTTKVINAVCDDGQQIRKLEAQISYNQGMMTVSSMKEVD